jgi:hypothetical protein
MHLYLESTYICERDLKQNWRITTISDHSSTNEWDVKLPERIAELEKANQALIAEIQDTNVLHTLSTLYIEDIDSHSF